MSEVHKVHKVQSEILPEAAMEVIQTESGLVCLFSNLGSVTVLSQNEAKELAAILTKLTEGE